MSGAFSRILHPSQSEKTEKWLQEHVPDFIETDDWPSASTNLNPLDSKLCLVLEDCVCAQRHQNLDSLNAVIVKVVKEIPGAIIRKLIGD